MKRISIIVIVCLCIPSLYAALCDFSFERVTSNASVDIASQFKLNVSSAGSVWDETYMQNVNRVTFKFDSMAGGVESVISEIYFYDGSLLNMYSIDESYPGVDFEGIGSDTKPEELSGYTPNSSLVAILAATEAENPEPKNGVKAGGWIKIDYTLLPGITFQDLLDEMAAGEVVVGVHVKSIEQPGGGKPSDSFVTVPEPATLAILGLGGLVMAVRNKRRV